MWLKKLKNPFFLCVLQHKFISLLRDFLWWFYWDFFQKNWLIKTLCNSIYLTQNEKGDSRNGIQMFIYSYDYKPNWQLLVSLTPRLFVLMKNSEKKERKNYKSSPFFHCLFRCLLILISTGICIDWNCKKKNERREKNCSNKNILPKRTEKVTNIEK